MINEQTNESKHAPSSIAPSGAIASLNDALRRNWQDESKGLVFLTTGIQALANSEPLLHCMMQKIADFDAFDSGNNIWGERDFGALEFLGQTIYWKIDYYDLSLREHSTNASDLYLTKRVLTVMLADEY